MDMPLEIGAQRYQADAAYPYARDPQLRFDQRRLASLVGYVAFGLPFVLGLGGLIVGRQRASLSAYYYEPLLLGDLFVGQLTFIGALLLAYRGWTRDVARLASIAGIAALAVALFPHEGWEELCRERVGGVRAGPVCALPDWLEAASPAIHFGAAAILFLVLAFFCLAVFTKLEPHQIEGNARCLTKRARDSIYRISGLLILTSIAGIAIASLVDPNWSRSNRLVYWLEFLALAAFGISWIVQGRASGLLLLDGRDRRDAALARARAAEPEN